MSSKARLFWSATVSFVFYFAWTYWANAMVSDDQALVLRSALVQGTLSGTVTLLFTLGLEAAVKAFGGRCLSLALVVPVLCAVHSRTKHNQAIGKTFNASLNRSAEFFDGACIPGTVLAPLLPLAVQSSLAIGVNYLNGTPNLWLTVAPSILFTALYGYIYTFTLLNDRQSATQP